MLRRPAGRFVAYVGATNLPQPRRVQQTVLEALGRSGIGASLVYQANGHSRAMCTGK
jgi:hypothetical protein